MSRTNSKTKGVYRDYGDYVIPDPLMLPSVGSYPQQFEVLDLSDTDVVCQVKGPPAGEADKIELQPVKRWVPRDHPAIDEIEHGFLIELPATSNRNDIVDRLVKQKRGLGSALWSTPFPTKVTCESCVTVKPVGVMPQGDNEYGVYHPHCATRLVSRMFRLSSDESQGDDWGDVKAFIRREAREARVLEEPQEGWDKPWEASFGDDADTLIDMLYSEESNLAFQLGLDPNNQNYGFHADSVNGASNKVRFQLLREELNVAEGTVDCHWFTVTLARMFGWDVGHRDRQIEYYGMKEDKNDNPADC